MVDQTMIYNGVVYHGFQAVVIGFLSGILAFVRVIFQQNKDIQATLAQIQTQEKQMAATIDDLNAAVAQEQLDVVDVSGKVSSLAAADTQAFADLQAKIAAGAAPADVSDAVNKLAASHTALANAASILSTALAATATADPGPTQVAPPAGS